MPRFPSAVALHVASSNEGIKFTDSHLPGVISNVQTEFMEVACSGNSFLCGRYHNQVPES